MAFLSSYWKAKVAAFPQHASRFLTGCLQSKLIAWMNRLARASSRWASCAKPDHGTCAGEWQALRAGQLGRWVEDQRRIHERGLPAQW